MRLATFNIYWLGDEEKITRTAADSERLARVVARLDADVIVFQEIVSPDALREILDAADELTSRRYAMHDADDRLLTTGGAQDQKIVAAYDDARYELRGWSPVAGGPGRKPLALRLRRRSDGAEVTVVGVHFQSGWPSFTDEADAEKRRAQCRHLADWLTGQQPANGQTFAPPAPGEHTVVLGDFNALYESDDPAYSVVVLSLDPLRELQSAGWWWKKPLADPAGGGRVTSYFDRLLIDFVMFSPSLVSGITLRPTIYAFDHDPAFFPQPPDYGEAHYRLSDHRPVFAEVELTP